MNKPFLLLAALAVLATSCAPLPHPDPYVRHGRRSGTLVGAGAGAVLGNNIDGLSSWEGAAAGAVIGGVMGDARGKANSAYYRRPHYGYYY